MQRTDDPWYPLTWDWQQPNFPEGATMAGIKAAVKKAELNGIQVSGSALDVPEDFDEAYQQEVVSVVAERFIKTGDLSWLEDAEVMLMEVLEYVGGAVRSLREEYRIPPPGPTAALAAP